MPNWCSNTLTVAGKDKKVIEELYDIFVEKSGTEGVFDKLFPTPKELLDAGSPVTDEQLAITFKQKYGDIDWYMWRVNTWGTKWDIHEVSSSGIEQSDTITSFCCSFDTAWSPPENAMAKISALYKNVYFHMEFKEEGMGFAGYASFMNGEDVGSVTVESFLTNEQVSYELEYYYDIAFDGFGTEEGTEENSV